MFKFQLFLLLAAVALTFVNCEPLRHPFAPRDGGLLCEEHPSHLLCGTNIPLDTHLPIQPWYITKCDIFVASLVHCCTAFCEDENEIGAGHCDEKDLPLPGSGTGACFCRPEGGKPKNCPVLTIAPSAPGYEEYENMVETECRPKCALNPNGCTEPTAVTAGILGTVCLCYCAD